MTEGQLHVLINGQEHIIGPGELVVVPPGTPHKFFNPADSPVVREPPERPRDFDLFLSQFYRFADEYPPPTHPLKMMLQMSRFRPAAWPTMLPIPVLRGLFFLIEPTARLLGYQRYYPAYVPKPQASDPPG